MGLLVWSVACSWPGGWQVLAVIYLRLGQLEQALATVDTISDIDDSSETIAYWEARSTATLYKESLVMAEEAEQTDFTDADLQEMADRLQAEALAKLQVAIEYGFNELEVVNGRDPAWIAFRGLPEFQQILNELNQPDR